MGFNPKFNVIFLKCYHLCNHAFYNSVIITESLLFGSSMELPACLTTMLYTEKLNKKFEPRKTTIRLFYLRISILIYTQVPDNKLSLSRAILHKKQS